MRVSVPTDAEQAQWPRVWRMVLVGLCALVLCSCRGPAQPAAPGLAGYQQMPPGALDAADDAVVPASATMVDGYPMGYYPADQLGTQPCPCPAMPPQGMPLAQAPGYIHPGSEDEYLYDGGDRGLPAAVTRDWELHGLELEDTVAHYDTVDGRRVVEPSNRVQIYAPRFGAVRQVVSLRANEQMKRSAGVYLPEKLMTPTDTQLVTSSKQNTQVERQMAAQPAGVFRSRQGDGALSQAIGPKGFQDAFLPYENLTIIRHGVMEGAEMARLAEGAIAAVAWEHKQAVQIILEHQGAMAVVEDKKAQATYTIDSSAAPKLRLIKVASTDVAKPGDEVAFTLRFDNVGDQVIGNVTIIDNLTTRLEYIADSAQCSVDAEFFVEPNEGDSVALRCEVRDPLPAGEGGIIRFRCRVR